MFDEFQRWTRLLMSSARNGALDGDMASAFVRTDSLVRVFVNEHNCPKHYGELLSEYRTKHPAFADAIRMPQTSVPEGAAIR